MGFLSAYDDIRTIALVIGLLVCSWAGYIYYNGMETKEQAYSYEEPNELVTGEMLFNGFNVSFYGSESPKTKQEVSFDCVLQSLSDYPKEDIQRIPSIQLLTTSFKTNLVKSKILYKGSDGPPSKEIINSLNMIMANCLTE